MAISPQQLTIYLYSAHRAVIFAIAQLSCLFVTITQYVLIPSPKLLQSTTLYRLTVRLRKNADNSVTVLYMREMHDDDAVNRVVNKEKSWETDSPS